ncbi:FhaA domain-containing protein [Glutamicibacter arilaitensis]|uniref:FhaA domain-containing protein n=1 Tax=Glutamicibacter arilaitensis TaxID=256701 RepID=UPI00384EE912
MSFLDNVERGLEKVVTSFFRGTSTADIKPVELSSALRNEMDRGILTISEGRSLAPNDFIVSLSDKDFATAKAWGSPVVNEMAKVTAEHAVSQGYSVQGNIMIHFVNSQELKSGEMEVSGSIKDSSANPVASAPVKAKTPAPQQERAASTPSPKTTAQPRPTPPPAAPVASPLPKQAVVEVNGQRFALHHHSIVLGRSASTDIPVDDTGVSRQHIRVEEKDRGTYAVTDLGSTNGTYVDGKKITGETRILDGSIITIGQTKIVFRLITPSNGGRA